MKWIFIANKHERKYDLDRAIHELNKIGWAQGKYHVETGDTVYLYEATPECYIRYKCKVVSTDNEHTIADETEYGGYPKGVPSFEFGITLDYEFMEPVPFTELTKHGISPKRINTTNNKRFPEVFEFLEESEQKEKANTEDSLEGNKSVTGGKHSQDNGHDVVKKYGAIDPKTYEVVIKAHYRSPKVAEDARKRANGICQLCGQPAPFNDPSGRPYLEVHHVKWLSRGGSDTCDNVVALCPNCHSRMHVLDDPEDIKALESVIESQNDN